MACSAGCYQRLTSHKAPPWRTRAGWQGPMLPSPQSDQPWITILIDSPDFLSHLAKVKWRKILTRATFASSMANLIPMQARGPWPKPKKVYLCERDSKKCVQKTYGLLLAFASLLKFSGLKTVELGKYFGSLCIPGALTITMLPFAILVAVPGMVYSRLVTTR